MKLKDIVKEFSYPMGQVVSNPYHTAFQPIQEDETQDPQEIMVGNYQTRHYDICPGASVLYKDIESKGVDMDLAERTARLQDVLFYMEKHLVEEMKSATEEDVLMAKNLQHQIMAMANMMGLKTEHSYIQGHIDVIEKLAGTVEESLEEAKSVTLITYGGREIKYKNSDIDKFIRNLDLNGEDLPGLIYKASMSNPNIIGRGAKSLNKKKEAILQLLKKIKSHSGDVIIDVDSKKPSFKHTVRFGLPESVNESKSDLDLVVDTIRNEYGNMPITKIAYQLANKTKYTIDQLERVFRAYKDIPARDRHKTDLKKLFKSYGLKESVNEAKEPEVISQLRSIVKDQQNKKIKDPVSGKTMRVDLYSASAVTQVYDAISKSNKDKFGKLSLPKMVNVAFKMIK